MATRTYTRRCECCDRLESRDVPLAERATKAHGRVLMCDRCGTRALADGKLVEGQ